METARLQAQVGCLIAEVGQLQDDRDEMAACIRSMQADQAYHAASERALEERVASLAADLVHAEGQAEALSQQAAQQAERIQQLEALLRKSAHALLEGSAGPAAAPEAASPGIDGRTPEASPDSRCDPKEPSTPAKKDEARLPPQQPGKPLLMSADGSGELVRQFWTASGRAAFGRADSAQDVSSKRRALSAAPSWQRPPQVRGNPEPCCCWCFSAKLHLAGPASGRNRALFCAGSAVGQECAGGPRRLRHC